MLVRGPHFELQRCKTHLFSSNYLTQREKLETLYQGY
uniref:Alcohol dehydrogenase 4 (class II), pi polypeptide n=1 Tax=Homo sapiens TaxID=9606 RepID=D6RF43_HUMAN